MKRQQRRRGIAIIWVVLLTMVFIGLIGLALDTGYAYLTVQQLNNAADAAALAAAHQLKAGETAARQAAVQIAAANWVATDPVQLNSNDANAADGDVVLGRYNRALRMFTPTLESPNAVQVTVRRTDGSPNGPLSMIFGPIFGVDTINVERTAIVINQGGTGAGLVSLCDDCECALKLTGTANLNLNGGPMQINSTDPCAVCGTGSGTIDSIGINVAGGVCTTPNVDTPIDTWTEAPPVNDPLGGLPEPAWDPAADLGAITVSGTYGPGYYSGGISLVDLGLDVTLLPGIYVLDGAGVNIGSDTILLAEGVMLFIPAGTGHLDISGNASVRVTPPDPVVYGYPEAATYEFVSIFQSRENSNSSRIIGTGLLDLNGTLYFPSADLEIGGTGDGFGNQLIAHTIWIHGTADITINYDGHFPAPGDEVFLVE